MLTDACGTVEIEVPRDRAGTFEPQIVKKRQRRLTDVDEVVLSLYARGLTTGEISAHLADIYGAQVSKDTISRITDWVVEEMTDLAHPSPGTRLRRGVHRRPACEDPRRPGRSTGPSMPRSGSIWLDIATCSGCGLAKAMASRPSTGGPS